MPAAAVIPAPIAYIKVVAVKKLVVEILTVLGPRTRCEGTSGHPLAKTGPSLTGRLSEQAFYLEKNRVFQAGLSGMH